MRNRVTAAMLPARDLPGAPATAATAGPTRYTAGAAAEPNRAFLQAFAAGVQTHGRCLVTLQ